MTESLRPVPRWLHIWAVLAVVATFLLLAVGQMVTSFHAGMADPIWPTEPWYLASNFKLDLGYLIEHSHRILGFSIGIIVSVLAFGLLFGERCSKTKWVSLAGVVILLGGYGDFHGGLIAQRDALTADVKLPMRGAVTTLFGLALALGATAYGIAIHSRGAAIRLVGVVALAAVMTQGLLGGFRVRLHELIGPDLATIHGIFAQVVFGLLVSLAVLTARSVPDVLVSRKVRIGAVVLAVLLFVQVVWGALVRHAPTILTQKLHFLTAFLATGIAVWWLMCALYDPAAKRRIRLGAHLLSVLLLVQIYLGVEAWMEKFGQSIPWDMVKITKENATIRTLHALIGSGLLATALGLAVRVRQSATSPVPVTETVRDIRAEASSSQPSLVTAGASQPGDSTA
ncbi:MAG: hypothetical protein K8U57_23420 [Planctomycetes bacterium]|nr:hypothetical protein [Planctomycetota bacterium]